MKPGVTDQLRRTAEVLRELALADVRDASSRRAVESALAGLELLAEAWPQVLPFLDWDNREMVRLLRDRGVEPPADRAADPLVVRDQEAVNDALRARLDELVAGGDGSADAEVLDHLDARARRYPLRYVPRLNADTDPES